jgi:hypothetical protein
MNLVPTRFSVIDARCNKICLAKTVKKGRGCVPPARGPIRIASSHLGLEPRKQNAKLCVFFRKKGTWLSRGLAAQEAVAGFFIGVAPTGVQASARPSARLPSAHRTGMSLAKHATVSEREREREHEMGGRRRAHTLRLLPAGRTTERIFGETCVCLADARARGRTARTRARAEAGTRTCMLQAACGRHAPVCGTTARTRRAADGRTTPPTTAAHPLAASAPGGGARPAAAAPASRAASPARGCCPGAARMLSDAQILEQNAKESKQNNKKRKKTPKRPAAHARLSERGPNQPEFLRCFSQSPGRSPDHNF